MSSLFVENAIWWSLVANELDPSSNATNAAQVVWDWNFVCTVNMFGNDRALLSSWLKPFGSNNFCITLKKQHTQTCKLPGWQSLATNMHPSFGFVKFWFHRHSQNGTVSHQCVHYITFCLLSVTWHPQWESTSLCQELIPQKNHLTVICYESGKQSDTIKSIL